jgi:hypothetical protein
LAKLAKILLAVLVVVAWIMGGWPQIREARAAINLVQTINGVTNGGTSVVVTFSSGATAGNLIIAICGARDGSTLSISSPSGFSTAINTNGTPSQGIFYMVAAGGETGITCSSTANTRLGLHIYEFSGTYPSQSAVFDAAATTATGSGTTPATNSVTTGNPNNLLIAGVVANANTACENNAWTNSFTEQNDFPNTGQPASKSTYCGATRTVAATGSYSTGVNLNLSSAWRADLAAFKEAPTFDQSAYRFFANDDSADVGAALTASQDQPATLSSDGDAFRLRLLLHVGVSNISSSGETFKLQFVGKGTGTCAAPSGGTPSTYTDVTGSTAIAYNNNSPADGDNLTPNASDPVHGELGHTISNQDYEEANNFANTVAAIPAGDDGKWDFSLFDNSAPADTAYCFRAVKSNDTALTAYSVYPQITTAAGSQSITFSISDNTIGFGTLSASAAKYASGDGTGASSDTADAHTMSASTNATGGYVISVNGDTLKHTGSPSFTISAIGGTAAASSPGTEQFGMRLLTIIGNGSATSPYNGSNWALDTAAFPDQVASGDGSGTTTIFGARYIGNITGSTESGSYSATLTYTITGTF